MQTLAKLNGKKGLIAAILTMALLIGAYNAMYYKWTVDYSITPLMSSMTLTIPETTGGTCGEQVLTGIPEITVVVEKPIKLVFLVEDEDTEGLEADYWQLYLTIELYKDGGFIGECILDLIEFGVDDLQQLVKLEWDDDYPVVNYIPVKLDSGVYTVTITATYWTGADGADGGSFPINVFAIEPEDISVTYDIVMDAKDSAGGDIGTNPW